MKKLEEFTDDRFSYTGAHGFEYAVTWKSSAGAVLKGIYSPELESAIRLEPYEVYKHFLKFPREKVKFHIVNRSPGPSSKRISVGYLINIYITIERHKTGGRQNS